MLLIFVFRGFTSPALGPQGMTVDNSTIVDPHLANSGLNLFGQPLSPSGSHPASPVSGPVLVCRDGWAVTAPPQALSSLAGGGLGQCVSQTPLPLECHNHVTSCHYSGRTVITQYHKLHECLSEVLVLNGSISHQYSII